MRYVRNRVVPIMFHALPLATVGLFIYIMSMFRVSMTHEYFLAFLAATVTNFLVGVNKPSRWSAIGPVTAIAILAYSVSAYFSDVNTSFMLLKLTFLLANLGGFVFMLQSKVYAANVGRLLPADTLANAPTQQVTRPTT